MKAYEGKADTVYLQVKLCEPCLSALTVCLHSKWRYINTLPFLYISSHKMMKLLNHKQHHTTAKSYEGYTARNTGTTCSTSRTLSLDTMLLVSSVSPDSPVLFYKIPPLCTYPYVNSYITCLVFNHFQPTQSQSSPQSSPAVDTIRLI